MREILTTIGLHLYQPPRRAFHHEIAGIDTDPLHTDWTAKILNQSYRPLSLGSSKNVTPSLDIASFDCFGVLRRRISELSLPVYERLCEQMRENGIGDPYLHPLLPDLSDSDKRILIFAGRNAYYRDIGQEPRVFWAPETALDYRTLNILAEAQYQAFICAPEQINRADGKPSDNQPTRVRVSEGRSLIAFPFDRPTSSALAFNAKDNADVFVNQYFVQAQKRVGQHNFLFADTDGETMGWHDPGAIRFLEYLLAHALTDRGFVPISINALLDLTRNVDEGFLNQRSAWSCPHGDLVRWHGECDCGDGDLSWKAVFYDAVHRLNAEITQVVAKHIPDFEAYLLEDFDQALMFSGGTDSIREQSLLAAKASALAAVTSCGTYFEDPHTSGNINILFALQACYHLHDAGLADEANTILESLKYRLKYMPSWTYKGHPGTVIGDLLTS